MQIGKTSHKQLARITGVMLIVMAVAAIFAEFHFRSCLAEVGQAHGTAVNIQAYLTRFRLGLLGYIIAFLLDVPVAVFLYVLIKKANETLAVLAMSFRLVYTAIVTAGLSSYVAGMQIINQSALSAGLNNQNTQSQILFYFELFDTSFVNALFFFSIHLMLLGWILNKSRIIPRIISILVLVGGISYFLDGILFYFAPSLRQNISPLVVAFGMAEVVLAIWFSLKGISISEEKTESL